MPLPLFWGIGAAIAGLAGIGTGVHGAVKMKEAKDTMESAQNRHERNLSRFKQDEGSAIHVMEELGKLEMTIVANFTQFSDLIEKIQNRPEFASVSKEGAKPLKYNPEELKQASVGAGVLLGGMGGAAVGTAAGFAAAGATTAAVMALGTASTGTAIASLSGVAATNATLAALGGGAIAAGGGGIALGTTLLGASTLGVGLLVGGVIFSLTGSKLSDKADEAWGQMNRAEAEINKICIYLQELKSTASSYMAKLFAVNCIYTEYLSRLENIIEVQGKQDWENFNVTEQKVTENSVLLVNLLFNMCKIKLVEKGLSENDVNRVNTKDVAEQMTSADEVIKETITSIKGEGDMKKFVFEYMPVEEFGKCNNAPELLADISYPPVDASAFAIWAGDMPRKVIFSVTGTAAYILLGTSTVETDNGSVLYGHYIYALKEDPKTWSYFMFPQDQQFIEPSDSTVTFKLGSFDQLDNGSVPRMLCRIFSQGEISGTQLDLLSQIGIIPPQSVPVDEVGPTIDGRNIPLHLRSHRLEPTDGKLVETIPNSADCEGDEFPEMVIDGDDNDRYFKCKLPKFRSIHEVLKFADTVRDALIKDFNEKTHNECYKSIPAILRAPKPHWVDEVNNTTDSSADNPNIVRFECDVSKFTAMSDVWLTAGKFQSKLVRAYQALDRPAPILKLFASFE